MKIGEVANETGLSISNIRFYEKKGLLSPSRKEESGYRDYTKDDIKRLKVLAENIEFTYEYNDNLYDEDGFKIYDTYKVIINNLTEELYVIEDKTDVRRSDYIL